MFPRDSPRRFFFRSTLLFVSRRSSRLAMILSLSVHSMKAQVQRGRTSQKQSSWLIRTSADEIIGPTPCAFTVGVSCKGRPFIRSPIQDVVHLALFSCSMAMSSRRTASVSFLFISRVEASRSLRLKDLIVDVYLLIVSVSRLIILFWRKRLMYTFMF